MVNQDHGRLAGRLNTAMPYVLDGTGAMLLSGSAMMWNVVAGTAALGLSVLYMSHRLFKGR